MFAASACVLELDQILSARLIAQTQRLVAEDALERIHRDIAAHSEQVASLGDQQSEALKRLATLREDRSSLDSRLRLLDEMAQLGEGLDEAVKRVLADRERHHWLVGMLGDMLETDAANAAAIEAALGEELQTAGGATNGRSGVGNRRGSRTRGSRASGCTFGCIHGPACGHRRGNLSAACGEVPRRHPAGCHGTACPLLPRSGSGHGPAPGAGRCVPRLHAGERLRCGDRWPRPRARDRRAHRTRGCADAPRGARRTGSRRERAERRDFHG